MTIQSSLTRGCQALFGLRQDLGLLSGDRYAMSASIFYLGFIVGAYPTMMLAQRYPIERVASGIVTIWGICLILTVVCKDYKTLYTQRFFLGFLESGISPMFMMIVVSSMPVDHCPRTNIVRGASTRRMNKLCEWGKHLHPSAAYTY